MPLKIYYLDDETELCENFSEYLESEEIIVTTFTDATKAIAAIHANPPDIFFTDYRMPEISGDQVALAIDSKIPKYLITGENNVETIYKFEKVFQKPCNYDEILEIIRSHLI